MPQAATLPTPSHSRRRARADRRSVPIEERVAVLETWSESIATRADVRGAENRLILWILGAVIALAGVFFAQLNTNTTRLDGAIAANTARIDKLDTKIDSRFDALMAELRALRRGE